jgi:hypothetical protein
LILNNSPLQINVQSSLNRMTKEWQTMATTITSMMIYNSSICTKPTLHDNVIPYSRYRALSTPFYLERRMVG